MSLSGKQKDHDRHHLLEDAEGVFIIGCGARSDHSVTIIDVTDGTEWNTAVGSIRPVNNAAQAARLQQSVEGESGMLPDISKTSVRKYKESAKGMLAWLPFLNEPHRDMRFADFEWLR